MWSWFWSLPWSWSLSISYTQMMCQTCVGSQHTRDRAEWICAVGTTIMRSNDARNSFGADVKTTATCSKLKPNATENVAWKMINKNESSLYSRNLICFFFVGFFKSRNDFIFAASQFIRTKLYKKSVQRDILKFLSFFIGLIFFQKKIIGNYQRNPSILFFFSNKRKTKGIIFATMFVQFKIDHWHKWWT